MKLNLRFGVRTQREGWPSGLRRTPGKRVGVNAPPGFESPSLRHIIDCVINQLIRGFVDFLCLECAELGLMSAWDEMPPDNLILFCTLSLLAPPFKMGGPPISGSGQLFRNMCLV